MPTDPTDFEELPAQPGPPWNPQRQVDYLRERIGSGLYDALERGVKENIDELP